MKTTILLPFILENEDPYDLLYNNFYGIFTNDTNKPDWENKIFLVYERIVPKKVLTIFNNSKYKYNAYTEYIENKTYKILAFTVPYKFKRDYLNIINNHPEKTNGIFRDKVMEIWKPTTIVRSTIRNMFMGLQINKRIPDFKTLCILNLNKVPIKKGMC